jgi:hypothetical protein
VLQVVACARIRARVERQISNIVAVVRIVAAIAHSHKPSAPALESHTPVNVAAADTPR